MLRVLRDSLGLLDRRDRFRWIATGASGVLLSAVEILSATMVLVLLRFLTGEPSKVAIPLLGLAGERWPSLQERDLIVLAATTTGILFLLRAGLFLINVHLQFRVAYMAGVRLSARLTRLYLSMPYRWHLERNSAQLVTNVVEAVNQVVVYVLIPSSSAVSNTVLTLTLLTVLVLTDAVSTLVGGAVLGLLIVVVLRYIRPRLGALARREIGGYEHSIAAIQEPLAGLRDVKIYALEDHAVAQLHRGRLRQARANFMRSTLTAVPRIVIETAAVLGMLTFLVARHGGASSQDAIATLGVFGYAIVRLLPTVSALMASINTVQYGAAATERLLEDLSGTATHDDVAAPEPVLPSRPDLVLRAVTLCYANSPKPALAGIDLTIPFGESVGVVGPTGSGKSTLLDVMAGLLDPTEGQVAVHGIPLSTCRRTWQSRLGVVPQSIVLVNDTLAANIAIGVAPSDVDGAKLEDAIERSQLSDVVAELPDGLGTHVGERGVRLSGGQRQRVAIARALYRRPSILIFDEGTAALDTATEAELIKAISSLRGSLTLIMVAHRLTTVRICDRILLVEDGRITGDGSFDHLAQSSAGFQRLAREA